MHVAVMKYIITAILAIYGLTPMWCDSCGETYLDSEMVACDVCGAAICPVCDEYYEGVGCYVCEGNAENIDTVECDSCGEKVPSYEASHCSECDSAICDFCNVTYIAACDGYYIPGCFVCNSDYK